MTARFQMTGGYTPSEPHVTFTAANYAGSGGQPVIWCHGANATITQVQDSVSVDARLDLDKLADRGCVVSASNLGGATTWGNDTGLASIDGQLTFLAASAAAGGYGTTGKVILIGDSHGAAVALNWAVRHASQVGAIVLRVPAVALQRIHDRNALGLAASMETAYTDLAGLVAAYPTRDPSHPTMSALLVSSGLASKMRCWYAVSDPVILAAEVLAFAAAIGCQATPMTAPSHAPWGYVDVPEQLQWIRSVQ